jgi:outer membrane lipopolysaccharide assembly protein LptE/RlpB
VMLMLLQPDDLLLIMLSLAACTHHLQRDTQTPTDDTHTGAISSSLCVYLRLRMYI